MCNVHHVKFCPVNLRLISCRALGNLDTSSGGRTDLLREGSAGRENRLLLSRRLTAVVDPDEWGLGLKDE